ncbi:SE1561 family protein [Bacillus sp. JCM 19034]|uniref:SE1561 family protein n=1 Tax=Bacillus sp. JCM 19034 TaxID=1481928 RepID=UPI0007817D7D|nr:SE1561 family protein [Bacillus sp. JCM 19034]
MSNQTEKYQEEKQMDELHKRLHSILDMLDSIDPEAAGVKEIDHILAMLDDVEEKCKQFRNS